MAVKNVQRIEGGTQNLTLGTLERIAAALETHPAALLAPPVTASVQAGPTSAAKAAVEDLVAAGFSVRLASAPGRRSSQAVPLTTMRAVAGGAGAIEAFAWVTVSGKGLEEGPAKRDPAAGRFIARVGAETQASRVKEGSVCLFGPPGPPPYGSRLFLVAPASTPDSGRDAALALRPLSARKHDSRVIAELVEILVPPRRS